MNVGLSIKAPGTNGIRLLLREEMYYRGIR